MWVGWLGTIIVVTTFVLVSIGSQDGVLNQCAIINRLLS